MLSIRARAPRPRGRFAFDVFNPSVQMLAGADGTRREMQRFDDPEQGEVRVDVEERYDAVAQVTRGVWYFSTERESDFLTETGGLRLLERYGDFSGSPFTNTSPYQVCVCEAA
jgi:hypothetical protein